MSVRWTLNVTVKDFDTGKPIEGCSILVYDFHNDIVENLVTDANGKAKYEVGAVLSRWKMWAWKTNEYPTGAGIWMTTDGVAGDDVYGTIYLVKPAGGGTEE